MYIYMMHIHTYIYIYIYIYRYAVYIYTHIYIYALCIYAIFYAVIDPRPQFKLLRPPGDKRGPGSSDGLLCSSWAHLKSYLMGLGFGVLGFRVWGFGFRVSGFLS